VCIGLASSLSSIALLSFFPDSYAATAGAYGLSFSSPTITSKITGTGVAQGITQVDIKKQGDVKVKKTRPVEGTYHRTARFADLATTGIVGCVSGKIDIFLVKFFGWLLA
jgi:hypothetical protein